MAEIFDLQRLEDQLYQYRPDLKRDSDDVKSERRKRLCSQLRYSYPLVELPAFDAVTSLVNIKTLLDKCKDSVVDSVDNSLEMEVRSPSTSLLESSVDDFLVAQRPRRVSRKRKSGSSFFLNSDFGESKTERKEQDSPLSLSILIPQVVKGSDKMEISIDLGGIDASQRLFGSRIDGLLRDRSNSTNTLEESPSTSNKLKSLQMTTSSCIQNIDSNDKQDDMLTRLISDILVENDSETLQATNVLDNINNNESNNYDTMVPVIENSKMPKKKRGPRKPKKESNENNVPKKRGRKPKNKANATLDNIGLPKSDLAKYVELFSNTCNMTGSVTPAASSTMSQQLVTSTTHYIDASEQPITYYLEGDWQNGGSCQLIQTENVPIDGGQEEFNMAELVNYIDNVGDAGNVIARVLDGPNTLPVLVQDSNSQNNSIVPPPAHVSDILLDLSKKSTMVPNTIETRGDFDTNSKETANDDIFPLDLSLKSSKSIENSITLNTILTGGGRLETVSTEVFDNSDYDSFRAALDMPLIDIDDNIKAFMELTNSEVITPANAFEAASTLTDQKHIDETVAETANITLPVCDFELSGIVENSDNTKNQNSDEFNNELSCSGINSTKNGSTKQVNVTEIFKSINTTVNTDDIAADVGKCTEFEKPIYAVSIVSTTDRENIKDVTEAINTLTKEDEHMAMKDSNKKGENNPETPEMITAGDQFEITTKEAKKNSEIHTSTCSPNVIPTECYDNTVIDEFAKKDDITNKMPSKLIDIEERFDTNDELQGNLSDKSSIDFLFVDTESLPGNKLKYCEESVADISSKHLAKAENDYIINVGGVKNNQGDNDNVVCDLPANDNNSKSIDLTEECQGHSVNLHLPMPQLTLMDSSSEEFCYDYDIDFESAEEKDLLNLAAKKRGLEENQRTDQNENNISSKAFTGERCDSSDACNQSDILTKMQVMENNELTKGTDHRFGNKSPNDGKVNDIAKDSSGETLAEVIDVGKENSTFEDSAVFCSHKYTDMDKEMGRGEKTLEQTNNLAKIENFTTTDDNRFTLSIQAEKSTLELSQQNMANSNENAVVKAEKSFTNLSVLEMESKLDNACLDFEDEIDDALSLTTSSFNSSDDERFPEPDKGSSAKTVTVKSLNEENNTTIIPDSSDVTKLPTVSGSSDNIFRKFKIPKISMTTATVKHGNPAVSVATTAPLPMVILPPNAFQKQSIKTEPDATKSIEKITRTVQNVCAVTPLTLKQSNFTNTTTSTSTTANSIDAVTPLIRDMLQMTPPIVDVKDFKMLNTGSGATVSSQHVNCTRGEIRGNGGDGRNFGPPTIVVAETFGVTCLPFLVERCFASPSCQYSHSFRDAEIVKNILSTLSEVDLSIAYKFAYSHEIVFRQYMPEFCKVYFERNNRFKLLNMVRDCERYRGGGELLITIFHSLINCGLNKVNACRQILSNSRDRSRTTIDALVNIILQADWTMFCDYIEKFSDISSYHFRLNVLHQMAPTILRANDQKMTSVFFKCLVNLDPKDVGLVQSSPILMQLLELIKNGQT